MENQYYLLPSQHDGFPIGSIFKINQDGIIDVDTNIEPIYDENIGDDWIQIYSVEKEWLLKKSLAERNNCHILEHYKKITELIQNDICFINTFEGDILGTIIEQTAQGFNVRSENGNIENVSREKVDLYTPENIDAYNMEEIMKLLLDQKGNIQAKDQKNRCVLSLAYEFANKSYFKMFLNTNRKDLDISNQILQTLLRKIIENNQLGLLNLVLQKCNIAPCNNAFLVDLSIEALKADKNELLAVILFFAPTIKKLANGETFLTNLFLEQIDGDKIKRVVEMQLFDVNVANDKGETPLTLACERLLVKVVDALLRNGMATINRNPYIQTAVRAGLASPDKNDQVDPIMTLLTEFQPVVNTPTRATPNQTFALEEDAELNPTERQLLAIMELLVINQGDIEVFNDRNISVLSLLYDLPTKKLFNIFVHKCDRNFNLISSDNGKALITRIATNKDLVSLKAVLDKCNYEVPGQAVQDDINGDIYDKFILNLAMQTLTYGIKERYKMIIDKCKNKDILLSDGEIFLTLCFKRAIKESLIIDVIKSNYFDINKCNATKETALMCACERLMTDCIELLIKKGVDKRFRDYIAFDIVVAEGNKADNPQNRKEAKNIILDLVCREGAEIQGQLEFTASGFVDTQRILSATDLNFGFKIGDPVITYSRANDGTRNPVNGVVKFIGAINDRHCIGIELNDVHPDIAGMDGVITDTIRFECSPGKGVLTTPDNVELDADALVCHYLPSRIIDPEKFLKCEEIRDKRVLNFIALKITDAVLGNIIDNGNEVKLKGVLRWFGKMNGDHVVVIELDEDYPIGTNGRFWRHQLINCADRRAIALNIENVTKYLRYKFKKIPVEERSFESISIGSRVYCYVPDGEQVRTLQGETRWSGVDEQDAYCYGVELDKKEEFATNGIFDGERLFECPDKRGIMSSMGNTAPEVFNETVPQVADPNNPIAIEGHGGSTVLDSLIYALFCNSDIVDAMLSSNLEKLDDIKFIKDIQDGLLLKIVCRVGELPPLRYEQIRIFGNLFNKNAEVRGNLEEDLRKFAQVMEQLSNNGPLLRFITSTGEESGSMVLKTSPKTAVHSTSQQLLDITMLENDLFLEQTPIYLLLQVPLDSTRKCLPLDSIEISHMCYNNYKKCSQPDCVHGARYRCLICAAGKAENKSGLLCAGHHKNCNNPNPKRLHNTENGSRSIVRLNLKSIICVSGNHSFAYIRQNGLDGTWTCFGGDVAGHREIPIVDEIPKFLENDPDAMIRELTANQSEHLKRISDNSHILVYFNPAMSCY